MRTPGRVVAEWVADEPGRNDLNTERGRIGRALDIAFYTATMNLVVALVAVGALVIAIDLVVGQ